MTSPAGCRFPRDYAAYGLRVRSSVPLPFARGRENLPAPGEPDVVVRLGATPAALPGPADRRRTPGGRAVWEAAPGAFLISLHGVARYLVTGGRDILVEPRGGGDREIGMRLAGTVWAALLLQRGIVLFHASAVEFEAGAVLFLGRSGAGKSSLLGELLKRGRAMLADDVAGVVLDAGGRPVALPAYPRLRLRADAVEALGWRGQAREREWMQPEKYRMPVPRFRASPLRIGALCLLVGSHGNGIEIEPVSPTVAFETLGRRAWRKPLLNGLGRRQAHFRVVAAMAQQVPVARVVRPEHSFQLDALADRIEAHVEEAARATA